MKKGDVKSSNNFSAADSLECRACELSVLEDASEFLQTTVWAKQKSRFGWEARSFIVRTAGRDLTLPLLVLLRRFAGFGIAYVPYAPSFEAGLRLGWSLAPAFLVEAISCALRPHLPRVVFIRFDLNWPLGKMSWQETGLDESALVKATANIQPPDTVILRIGAEDLQEDDILAGMKSKTRYNIRLATKRGVQVQLVPRKDFEIPPEFDDWYALYQITESRNHIALHSREYYAHLFLLTTAFQCRIYLARHEGECLAGIIVLCHGTLGRYLYGASANSKRSFMPAYALQWRAICDLRREGLEYYDFFGIPPTDAKKHSMSGLYQFKTGFGGEIVHSPGSWDMPLMAVPYFLYQLAERVRMYYHRRLKKKSMRP